MSFIVLLFGAYIFANLSNKKITTILPMWSSCISIILYFLGITRNLSYLNAIKYIIFVILVGLFLTFIINKRDLLIGIKDDSGLIIMLLYTFVIGLLLRNHLIIEWDDISHWAMTVKQIFLDKNIPTGLNSISNYSDYQPLSALLYYWFVSDFKIFHENLLLPSQFLIIQIFFCPLWNRLDYRKNRKLFFWIELLLCIILPFAVTYHALLMVKVDSIMTAIFAYGLCVSWDYLECKEDSTHHEASADRIYKILPISFSIIMLVISKAVGVFLALVLIAELMITGLAKKSKKNVLYGLLGGLIAFATSFSWKLYCKKYECFSYITDSFSSIPINKYIITIKLFGLAFGMKIFICCLCTVVLVITSIYFILTCKKTILHKAIFLFVLFGVFATAVHIFICTWFDTFQFDMAPLYTIRHYIYTFCQQPATFLSIRIDSTGISVMDVILVEIYVILVVYQVYKIKATSSDLVTFISYVCTIYIMFMIYIWGHASMYCWMFSGEEVVILSAFNRYLIPFLGGALVWVAYVSIRLNLSETNMELGKVKCMISTVMVLLIIFMVDWKVTYKELFCYEKIEHINNKLQIRNNASNIVEQFPKIEDKKHYSFICPVNVLDLETYYFMKYLLYPNIPDDILSTDTINWNNMNRIERGEAYLIINPTIDDAEKESITKEWGLIEYAKNIYLKEN